ncbi:hypothetical protein RP726_13335 [Candidatus Methylospira mobilis]|uniref:hypothetical protein n=1 Tax=Candidatus Methylospira mobilis TaxID=1808979 RepID=UPI001D17C576|nr:hypothetical protein [Candidatus Methylospira mobilis]WNV03434.1 hypothetical protein RP726_13335 [Candidatus Methylospira mobilis]
MAGRAGQFSASVAAHLQTAWKNVVAVQSSLAHGRVADRFATRFLEEGIGFILITQVFRRVRPKKLSS